MHDFFAAAISIVFISAIIFFSLHQRKRGHLKAYPGMEQYLLWISTFIWAASECIIHDSRTKFGAFSTTIRRDVLPTTVLTMLGFVLIFLPFVAGLFYFVISPMLLFMIPLSSLILCVANGLYPSPGFLLLVSIIALASLGAKIIFSLMVGSWSLYCWLLRMNIVVILSIMLLLAVAGYYDYETIRGPWNV